MAARRTSREALDEIKSLDWLTALGEMITGVGGTRQAELGALMSGEENDKYSAMLMDQMQKNREAGRELQDRSKRDMLQSKTISLMEHALMGSGPNLGDIAQLMASSGSSFQAPPRNYSNGQPSLAGLLGV